MFEKLLEAAEIENADDLATALDIPYTEAEEVLEAGVLDDDEAVAIIRYYDEKIVPLEAEIDPDEPLESEPEPEPMVVVETSDEGVTVRSADDRIQETIEGTVDSVARQVLRKLWGLTPGLIGEILEGVAIPVGMLGGPEQMVTAKSVQSQFQSAQHQLSEMVLGKLKERIHEDAQH